MTHSPNGEGNNRTSKPASGSAIAGSWAEQDFFLQKLKSKELSSSHVCFPRNIGSSLATNKKMPMPGVLTWRTCRVQPFRIPGLLPKSTLPELGSFSIFQWGRIGGGLGSGPALPSSSNDGLPRICQTLTQIRGKWVHTRNSPSLGCFLLPSKSLAFSGLMENPLVGKKLKS